MKSKIKKNFNKSLDFLKDSKNYIYFIIVVFFIFGLIGYFIHIPSLVERIFEFIQEILEKTKDMSFLELNWFILFNNVKVAIFGILIGILLGIMPIALAMINGYMLGFVASMSVVEDGFLSLLKIVPHAIFELPAVFISLGLGVRLGLYTFYRRKNTSFKKEFENVCRIFVFIVLPLLIIASIIETGFIFIFR